MIWKKYEFTKSEWNALQPSIEVENSIGDEVSKSWNPELIVALVDLGNLVVSPAVLNEEGEVVTEAVMSSKKSVDILWQDQSLESFVNYEVDVESGKEAHQFAGMQWK